MYAIVDEGKILEYPIHDLRRRFPQTSFPDVISDDSLPDGVIRVHTVDVPPYDANTHKVIAQEPVLQDGQWVVNQTVALLEDKELVEQNVRQALTVRSLRDQKLRLSDWTQLADAPVDKSAWATYRQALRDIPSQPGFPATIDWPQEP